VTKMPIDPITWPGRICWFCQHVYFDGGSPCYSDLTPGTSFQLECTKGYWRFDRDMDCLDEFREKLESAERCASFSERPRKP
jgi:hypothetical protein